MSLVFNDQDNEFESKKLTNLDSVTVNRSPTSDTEIANKKYIVDSLGESTVIRFNQTMQHNLKDSVGNDV